jgi:hypothetical protein
MGQKPSCPHCGHELTLSDVGAINAALRVTPQIIEGKRKKPRVREAMPFAFEILKSDGQVHQSREIFDYVTGCLAKVGLTESKRIATGYALTWMKEEGLVQRVRHGYWQITKSGKHVQMTDQLAERIERKYDPAFRRKVLTHN